MHILFIHQNYPAQFGHIARYLVQRKGFRCTFLSQHAPPHGDGPRAHLLAAHAGEGAPESVWPPPIGVELGGLIHRTLSSFDYGR